MKSYSMYSYVSRYSWPSVVFRFIQTVDGITAAAAAAKSLQPCPTLCDPIDSSPPGSSVHGILQARTLEWVAISFSSTWKWKVKVKSLSCVWLCSTPQTAAYHAPLSMGFSRQEYWSGLPLPSPMVSLICSFLILRTYGSTNVCMHYGFLNPFSCWWTFELFPCVAMMNKASRSIYVQVFCRYVFLFPGSILRIGIARSWGRKESDTTEWLTYKVSI